MLFFVLLAAVNGFVTIINKMINLEAKKSLGTINGTLINYLEATVISLVIVRSFSLVRSSAGKPAGRRFRPCSDGFDSHRDGTGTHFVLNHYFAGGSAGHWLYSGRYCGWKSSSAQTAWPSHCDRRYFPRSDGYGPEYGDTPEGAGVKRKCPAAQRYFHHESRSRIILMRLLFFVSSFAIQQYCLPGLWHKQIPLPGRSGIPR